jgi:uncharacterized membrane protein YcaP (DUF421 family)
LDLSFLIPDTSPIEIVVRGSITYVFIFLLLRVLKRQSGAVSTADLLLIVLVADAAQNSMAGQYTSVADGLLLVTTIAVWAYVLDWLGYHFRPIERFVHPPPRPIVRDGQMIPRNMRAELVTQEELMTTLRTQGIEDVGDVKVAFVEGNGEISVIKTDGDRPETRKSQPGA